MTWKKVYSDRHEHKANIVLEHLRSKDISAVVLNKKDSNYQFGNIEVLVKPEQVDFAIKTIKYDIKFE